MPATKNPVLRERNCQRIYGCSEAQAIALNEGHGLRDRGCWAMKYCIQRQAAKKRGIPWEITFPEWLSVWRESGLMEFRGVGRAGYCMARHGDEGAYRVDNVSIKSCVENSREGIQKSHSQGKLKQNKSSRALLGCGRGWTYRGKGPRPYQVIAGAKYVGCFATEQEAVAAYRAAVEKFVSHAAH